MKLTTDKDLTSLAARANPYPRLSVLRESLPVCWHEDLRGWCLTRHEDVERAFKDSRFRASRINQFVAGRSDATVGDRTLMAESIALWLVFNDPPRHTYLRKLTQDAFSLRTIETKRRRIEVLADELLEPYLAQGSMEFVSAFAYPLPATVSADLLGVPREHIDELKRWSDDLGEFVLSTRVVPEKFEAAAAAMVKMNELFGYLLAEKRRYPGNDLMDTLIGARDGRDAMSEEELIAFCVFLLFAGHETTTHFLSNSVRALADDPGQFGKLDEFQNDRRRMGVALDELLRLDGPIIAVSRVTAENLEVRGQRLEEGDRVYLFAAAANRDPRVFHSPDKLDVERKDAGRMLGFGFGIHLCLGIHLARLEAAVALPRLYRHLPNLRVAEPPGDWTDTLVIRGPRDLQVCFGS